MKTARTKSIDAMKSICIEAGIHIASETATKILDVLERERKEQDRDTRHACAEAVADLPDNAYDGDVSLALDDARYACMNVKAV